MSLNPSIRKVVPASPPTAAATYDYYDIAEGTGIKNFYGALSIASGSHTAFLTTDTTAYSGMVVIKRKGALAWGLYGDVDYETTFNSPKLVKGNIRISATTGVQGQVANAKKICLLMALYKVSGGVPTQIGSNIGTPLTSTGAVAALTETHTLTIDVTDRIHFKIGDILRLNVKMYGAAAGATEGFGYGCDPADRNDSVTASGQVVVQDAYPTHLKVAMPFIITDI